jgi:aminoglycoside phosphotransferase (APT) family kinase protein
MDAHVSTVRRDDSFDVAGVDDWLKDRLPLSGAPAVQQFTGGASNLTYLLRYPSGPELVLRRPPAGAPAAAHDMAREFHVQELLKPLFPHVPTVRALCQDPSVIGSDFYVMDRVAGLILCGDGAFQQPLPPERCRALAETFVDTLAELHAINPRESGLHTIGKGDGYVARQVEGWTRRYTRARTHNVPSFNRVTRWLADHRRSEVPSRVVHDWRLDNLVLDPADLRACDELS